MGVLHYYSSAGPLSFRLDTGQPLVSHLSKSRAPEQTFVAFASTDKGDPGSDSRVMPKHQSPALG